MTLDRLDTLIAEADPARGHAIPDGSSPEARWRYLRLTTPPDQTGPRAEAGGRTQTRSGAVVALRAGRTRRRVVVGAAVASVAAATAAVLVLALLPAPSGPTSAAAAVLLDAAAAAGQAPPLTPGQYLYTETQTEYGLILYAPTSDGGTQMTEVATAQYATTVQGWTGSRGMTTTLVTTGTKEYPSSADRAAWQAVAPTNASTPATGGPLPRGASGDGSPHPVPSGLDAADLPTDPAALATALRTGDYGTNAMYLNGPDAVFERAATLLIGPDQGMTPALAKALFQVMAQQPGAELLGTVTDHSGQQGDAVSFPPIPGSGPTEVVVDPSTGALLEADYAPPAPVGGSVCTNLGPVGATVGPVGTNGTTSSHSCIQPVSALSIAPAWTDVVASGVVGSSTTTLPPHPGATVTRTLVPDAPTGLTVTTATPSTPGTTTGTSGTSSTSGTVELTWTPPTDAGATPITGYVVHRYTGPGRDGAGGTTGTSVSTTPLVPGTTYTWTVGTGTTGTYTVQAVNAYGAGPASSPITLP